MIRDKEATLRALCCSEVNTPGFSHQNLHKKQKKKCGILCHFTELWKTVIPGHCCPREKSHSDIMDGIAFFGTCVGREEGAGERFAGDIWGIKQTQANIYRGAG